MGRLDESRQSVMTETKMAIDILQKHAHIPQNKHHFMLLHNDDALARSKKAQHEIPLVLSVVDLLYKCIIG